MPRKKTIDISGLPEALQATIRAQLDKANTAEEAKEAIRAKAAMKFYYKVKDEIQAELLKKLAKMPNGEVSPLALKAAGDNGWSKSKILKIIATIPNRKPTKDEGYVRAARNIEQGKKRKLTDEAKAKKEAREEAKTKREAATTLFKTGHRAPKTKVATKKKAKATKAKAKKLFKTGHRPKPKSVGAMAVGDDGLTKHQRYEPNRARTPEQLEAKNEARRRRRAAGKSG